MISTKKTLPEVYSESFDMSVFTGLLDLLYGARELDQLRAKNIHSPSQCFTEDLSRLASLFNLSSSATRQLISNYRLLVKKKGSALAIKSLALFAAGLEPLSESVILQSTYISPKGAHIVAYVNFTETDATLLEQLIYRLAPVGVFVSVRPMSELPVSNT